MSTVLNINELYNVSKRKKRNKTKCYNEILKKCHNRIKFCSLNEKTKCIYKIPQYTIGYPLYDYSEITNYIINALRKNGFDVSEVYGYIYISWDKGNKIKNNKIDKKQNDYRPIEDYNPIGSVLYNDKSLISIKNKSEQLLNNHQ